MTTQDLLDPKSWAERTFGGVQLHDLRRTKRAGPSGQEAGGEPLGFFASSNADLARE